VPDNYKDYVGFDILWRVEISQDQLAELVAFDSKVARLFAEAEDAKAKYLQRLREIVGPEVNKKLSTIGAVSPDATKRLPPCYWTPEIPGMGFGIAEPLVEIRATNKSEPLARPIGVP
jgi:hypothetical protein